MTTAWMVRQGRGGQFAEEMIAAGYLGVDFIGDYDLTPHLGGGSDAFRSAATQVFLGQEPDKGKIAAGLAAGNLWWACEGITEGDLVLAPKPDRTYQYGVVTGGYQYHPGTELPHRFIPAPRRKPRALLLLIDSHGRGGSLEGGLLVRPGPGPYVVTMTMQPSSSASGTALLASLRVQVQVNGGPQRKADLQVYKGGLAISWSIGLFGQKASSNPEGIIVRWPDLVLAHISGLPASEYSDPEPFARLRIAEGPPVITLFSEKHVRLTCRPTVSNDPAAFVLEVRAIAAGVMADNTRKFEAKMAALEERRFQDEMSFIIERARRYVSDEPYMASVRCRLVLPDGEVSGHAILFYGQLCFFDQADISAEDVYSRYPLVRYPGHTESCEVRTPEGVTLNGRGVPLYSASTLSGPDIYFWVSFGPGDDMTLKVPYASLSPARQRECVESLNEFLKAIADYYANA